MHLQGLTQQRCITFASPCNATFIREISGFEAEGLDEWSDGGDKECGRGNKQHGIPVLNR
jgi:hypothetical protein